MYPPLATDVAALKAECAPFLAMEEAALLRLVPPQAGFWFGDCPNCDQGAQEHQIVWAPALGGRVQCRYCKHVFPSEQYPENGALTLKTPSGGAQRWKYHEAKDGARYWFEARRWHEQKKYMDQAAYDLAQLWALTKDREAGRRAALILHRFAQAYPDYIVHYDYPHRPKRFFTDGVPEDFEPYRAAKWSWWAYADISLPLLKTYDLIASGDFLTPDQRARVERDLFRGMLDFVARYDDARLTNMHPTTWTSMAVAARVLRDDALADKVLRQMRRLLDEQFFYDGFWKEGTASYHQQTTKGVRGVLRTLHPGMSADALDARIRADYPDLARALHAADALRLPDGRFAPLRDTWVLERQQGEALAASRPALLPGLGYAVLGMGAGGEQLQAHLNFTGRFGHNHYDSLGLLLHAFGKELFSDIGYTHSRARPWTMTTASHNTVIVDQLCQNTGDAPDRCRGHLLLFEGGDPDFQVVAAEVPNAYPGRATTYRRCLIAVAAGGARYVVDIFDVAGGKRHDWVLHGSADEAQTLEITAGHGAALPMDPLASLLPPDFAFVEPRNEGDARLAALGPWAYGLFRNIRSGRTDAPVVATFRGREDPRVGVRTWVLGAPGTRVTTATAWAVRGIGKPRQEDAAKLDQFQRQALLIGRAGPVNRFIALHCPFEGDAAVTRVTPLPLLPDGVALKVERAGGADYLLFGADGARRTGQDGALRFEYEGQVALVTTGGGKSVLKMVGGTRLAWGDRILTATAPRSAKLLRVEGQELTVAGAVTVDPGAVIIVRHGDGATTPFHVAAARQEKGVTVIRTQEPPALLGSAEETLRLKQFPQNSFPAPHEVLFTTRQASGGASSP